MEQMEPNDNRNEHPPAVFNTSLAESGAQVVAPVIAHNVIGGDLNCITNIYGTSEPSIKPQEPDQSSITDYFQEIIQRNEFVKEYNTTLGDNLPLENRYTDLLIIQKQRDWSEREKEICSKGELFQELMRNRECEKEKYHTTSLDQFFIPDSDGKTPQAVVLQGNSGNGKSFTVKWITLGWAQRRLYTDNFDFIFHLECKEINTISDNVTLVELLQYSHSLKPEQILWILRHSSERILFLIDGFDELRSLTAKKSITSVQKAALPEEIICALLSGSLLRKCFLLVTTRSMAADSLSKLLKHPQRYTEIMGFSEQGVQTYFEKFFKDKQLSHTQAYERVKANETLYTACSIPVVCWIVCTVLNNLQAAEDEDDDEDIKKDLETTTSIYVEFMLTMLEYHSQGMDVCSALRSLGQLAEKGTKDQKVLFDKKSIPKDIAEEANVPFLCKFLLKKVRLVSMFNFVHLSFQEFFAALHYTFLGQEELRREVGMMLESLQIQKDQHLLPVVQYLFGLSNEDIIDTLGDTYDLSSFAFVRPLIEDWVLKAIRCLGESKHELLSRELFILHCLYELHDRDFVKKAMEHWGKIVFHSTPLRRTDCWVLRYCLLCCQRIRSLSLNGCFITPDKMRMLQPALCKCGELSLIVEDLSDDDVKDLVLCLGEGTDLCNLRVWNSALSDQSLQQVLGAVSKQKTVGRLEVAVKTITTDSAVLLANFMTEKDVRELELMDGDEKSVFSSIRMYRKEGDTMVRVGHSPFPTAEPSVSEMSFVCPHSHLSYIKWTNIFQTFYNAKSVTETSPEFDERSEALLSSLGSVTGLIKIELRISSLTNNWASRMLSLFQNNATLLYICLEETKGEHWDKKPLYSSLAMLKKDGHFTLCIGDYVRTQKALERPQTKALLSEVCATCSLIEISRVSWENFLNAYDEARGFSAECEAFDERCSALLCALTSVPGLKEVDLRVTRVSENWAMRMLSLIQTCSGLRHVGLATDSELLKIDSVEESLCVSLSLDNKDRDFMLSISGRDWIGKKFMGFTSAKNLTLDTKSALSGMSVTCPHSTEISSVEWTKFFKIFNELNGLEDNAVDFDGQFVSLLSFLSSVPELKEVGLNVNILSKSWATRILDLMHFCPSLPAIRLAAGGGRGKGLLLEGGLKLLQEESKKKPDCLLTLEGWRCTKQASDQCTREEDWNLECNQSVQLQLRGQTWTEGHRCCRMEGEKQVEEKD